MTGNTIAYGSTNTDCTTCSSGGIRGKSMISRLSETWVPSANTRAAGRGGRWWRNCAKAAQVTGGDGGHRRGLDVGDRDLSGGMHLEQRTRQPAVTGPEFEDLGIGCVGASSCSGRWSMTRSLLSSGYL